MYVLYLNVSFWSSTRGSHSSAKRYRYQMVAGYSIPIGLTVVTAAVEFSGVGGECAEFRPRFGEETCTFTGGKKFIISY